jgi:hypothetical protein
MWRFPSGAGARGETLAGAVGDTTPRETPESGQVDVGDVVRRTAVLCGEYDTLLAALPARGAASADYPGYSVDGAVLTRLRGDLGKLTVRFAPTEAWAGTVVTAAEPLADKIEIDFMQLDRPLLTHPKLNKTEGGGENNFKAVHLQRWIDSGKDTAFWTYEDAAGEQTLTEDERAWAAKIASGVEAYMVFVPVVTRTRTYASRPEVGPPGAIEDPPEGAMDGWEYLKTADKATQNDDSSWTRAEQWTGSDEWDADIYGEEDGE